VDGDECFTFDTFISATSIINTYDSREADTPGFLQAFQVFDPEGTGRMPVSELRYVLTSMGEKLSETEVDELINRAGHDLVRNGFIQYEEFVKRLVDS